MSVITTLSKCRIHTNGGGNTRRPESGLVPEGRLGIATDLYQLTMANGYHAMGRTDEIAVFDLFVRKLPKNRSYMMVAGLEQALHYLTNVRFTDDDIELLRDKPTFKGARESFWEYLADFRFTGDAWAMPEGTIAFGNEPLMTVEAPIIEAQVAETYLLMCYNHQTKIATKAARCVEVAKGRSIIEFGMRRTDVGAALRAARAAFIGGAMGTSNVLADAIFGIPSYGTHAHSWVMSFDTEDEAFKAYFQIYGEDTLALIDTYDTVQGAEAAARLPGRIKGVRLDSGDIAALSKEVRAIMDAAGKKDGRIFATNDLNEYKIAEMLEAGAEIDIFGIGTELVLSADSPSIGGVYKLAEIEKDGRTTPKLKLSKDKSTFPGRKQVYRLLEGETPVRDVLGMRGELDGELQPLLVQVVDGGRLLADTPRLADVQAYATGNRMALPEGLRDIAGREVYEVAVSDELDALTCETVSRIKGATA
ncbi:MAG: nicotinate phosphoribosyltransferase [Candidatus Thermoplasmatota archaeon]